MTKRIDQILPTISYGDAVSNDTVALMHMIREMGYDSDIYAENIHPKMHSSAKHIEYYKKCDKENTVIYHMSTGSKLSSWFKKLDCRRKIMIYHNITPPEYFRDYSDAAVRLTKDGKKQLAELRDTAGLVLADSEYNKEELDDLGYENTHVLPILMPFDDYKEKPCSEVIDAYDDDWTNIIFVGRIVPNKKQEDVIKSFYYYKKYINPKAGSLVGSHQGMEKYHELLQCLVEELDVEDVYFTGHIPFDKILGYYRVADLFLCMSEHEGFCVPLIESMIFQVPILAYSSTAIPYTLGNSGILVKEKNYKWIAGIMNEIVTNTELRNQMIKRQNARLSDFENNRIKEMFKKYITDFIG